MGSCKERTIFRYGVSELNDIPKFLIGLGIVLVVIGLVWLAVGRFFPIGRLPGDIVIEKGNVRFYFPIVTCIIISVMLSLIAWIARMFMK